MTAILILSGGGGPHSLFAAILVRSLAEAAHGAITYAHASDVPAFREAFLARRGHAFVAFLEAPSPECALVLSRSRSKIAIFPDGFEDSVGFLMEQHGADFASAVRYATRGAASVTALLDRGNAGLLPAPAGSTLLAHHVRRLALFFGIEPSGPLVADLLARLGFAPGEGEAVTYEEALVRHLPARLRSGERLAALAEADRDALQAMAPGYDGLFGPNPPAILWPPRLCFLGDRPGEALHGPIDLTGPARTLSYGPYLHLPPGDWEASVTLATGANRSGNRVSVRFVGAAGLREADRVDLPEAGRIELRTPLAVETASEGIELLLAADEGAIEGWAEIEAIALRKQPE